MSFSWKERRSAKESLSARPPEVLIVGAGVVGCAIAAWASRFGMSCLLVDKEDLAAGASSASTGLAHAGLRYLAQGRLGYVLRAGHERRRLQELAPHCVHPFTFILPVYRGGAHSFASIRFGTWIYDQMGRWDARLGRRPAPAPYKVLTASEVMARAPGLSGTNLEGGVQYSVDAELQDARLVLGLAQAASRSGARILTHAELRELKPSPQGGPVAWVEDHLDSAMIELRPRMIINATGAWIDEVRQRSGFQGRVVQPSRGIHLVVDQIAAVPLIFSTEIPGRVFFVLPGPNETSIVGTTDTAISGSPDDSRPEPAEVADLLQRLLRHFPYLKQGVLADSIRSYREMHVRNVFWGERPLLHQSGSTLTASREHALVKESPFLWSVPGVKLTSGWAVGEDVARALWVKLRRGRIPRVPGDSLPGGELWDYDRFLRDAERRFRLGASSDAIIRYLVSTYGTRYVDVLQWANREPHYREKILEGEPWILAQVPYAIEEEMVLTLNDLLWRRTKWAIWRRLPEETVLGIAQEMAEILKWSPETRQAQIEAYRDQARRHLPPAV